MKRENRKLSSSESQNIHPSKSRQAVRERREQFYRLWLQGWTEEEIAKAHSIHVSNVSRAIKEIRSGNTWLAQPIRERYSAIIGETYDLVRFTVRESFRNYYALKGEERADVVARSIILGRVQNAAGIIARLAPDLGGLWLEEKLAQAERQQAEIRKGLDEQRMKERVVHPIA